MFRKVLSSFVVCSFLLSSVVPPRIAQAQTLLQLPEPGTMVQLSEAFQPTLIKGITIHPENPLLFDFIVDPGQSGLNGEDLKSEGAKLIRYFLATLTVPEKDLWVNLSPYEKNRIIPDGFGKTEMGRDVLAQDYILKQMTSTLIYPENDLGKKFWDRVYEKARGLYGSTEIPVDTFDKVWIVPEKAVIYTNENRAFVAESHLKVMLEEDYLAMSKTMGLSDAGLAGIDAAKIRHYSETTTKIIREILIPEVEKEVNQGKNFAALRQVYNSVILAAWFKNNLKESLLGQLYVNKDKTAGIDLADNNDKMAIYNQYIEALKKGVFNYIKEEKDSVTHEVLPRKYFSGGTILAVTPETQSDFAGLTGQQQKNLNSLALSGVVEMNVGLFTQTSDALQAKDFAEKVASGDFPKARLSDYPDEWFAGKTVFIRADFNIPESDFSRIEAGIPTIKYATSRGAKVVVASHLGKPKGANDGKNSLKRVAVKLQELGGFSVIFNEKSSMAEEKDTIAGMKNGEVLMLENSRFNQGEEALVNAKKALAKAVKSGSDVEKEAAEVAVKQAQAIYDQYVADLYQGADMFALDGFSVGHRAHGSVVGAPKSIPRVAGLLVEKEVVGLTPIAQNVDTVFMAGSKVTTKLPNIDAFLNKGTVKKMGIGGAMANAFFVGKIILALPNAKEILDSFNEEVYEELLTSNQLLKKGNVGIDFQDVVLALKLLQNPKAMAKIVLPVDAVVVSDFTTGADRRIVSVDAIPKDMIVVDIGPATVDLFDSILKESKVSFWNGPMGAFEKSFAEDGTKNFASRYAAHKGYTGAGGGDTVAAINLFGIVGISFVSLSGGAAEEFLAGKLLPGLEQLSEPPAVAFYQKQYQAVIDAIKSVFPGALILPSVSTRKIDTSVDAKDSERKAALDPLVGPSGERIIEVPQATEKDLKDYPGLAKDWMDFPIIVDQDRIPGDLKAELAKAKTPKDTSVVMRKYLEEKMKDKIDFHREGSNGTDVQGTLIKTSLAITEVIAIKTGAGNLMIRMPFWFMRNEEALATINKMLGAEADKEKEAWEISAQKEEAVLKAHWFENVKFNTSEEAIESISSYGFMFFDEFSSGNYQHAPLLAQLLNKIDVTKFLDPEKYGIVYDESIGKLISTLDKESKIPYFGDNLKSFLTSITYVGSLARFMNGVLMPEYDAQNEVGKPIANMEPINAAFAYYHRMYNHLLMLGYNNSPELAKMFEPERMTLGNFAGRLNQAVLSSDALDINQSSAVAIWDFLAEKGIHLSDIEMKRLTALMSSVKSSVWAHDIMQLAEAFDENTFVQAMSYLKVGTKKMIKPSEMLKPNFLGGAGQIGSMTLLQRIVRDYNAQEKGYTGQYVVQSRELKGATDQDRFKSAVATVAKMFADEGVANAGLNIDGVLVGQMLKSGDIQLKPQEKKLPAKADMVVDIPINAVYPVDIVIKGKTLGTVYYVNVKEFKDGMSTDANKALALSKLKTVGINSVDNIPYPLVVEINGEDVLFGAISDGTPGGVLIGNGVLEELLDTKAKEEKKRTGKEPKLYDGPTMWQLHAWEKYDDGTGENIGGAPEELGRWKGGISKQFNLRLGGNPGVIDSEQIYKKLVMPLGGGMHVFGPNIDKLAMVNEKGATILTPTSCSTNGASYYVQALLAFLGLGMKDITVLGPTLHDDTSGALKKVFGRMMTKNTGAGDGVAQHQPGNFMFTALRTPVALENGKVKVVGGSLYDLIQEMPIAVSPELLMKWLERTSVEFPEAVTIFGETDKKNGKFTWKDHISGQQTGSILLGPVELIAGKYFRVTDGYDNVLSFSFKDAEMQNALNTSLARQKDTGNRITALAGAGLELPGAAMTQERVAVVADMAMQPGLSSADNGMTVDQMVKEAVDNASNLGGININPSLIDMQIKKDKNGKTLMIKDQPIGDVKINGLVPVILNVTPVFDMPLLLGLNEADGLKQDTMLLSKN